MIVAYIIVHVELYVYPDVDEGRKHGERVGEAKGRVCRESRWRRGTQAKVGGGDRRENEMENISERGLEGGSG